MKRLIIFLMLAALSVAGIAQSKKGTIREGLTTLSKPILFTAADSIAGNGGYYITASETYEIRIVNVQKYLQFHTITVTLDNTSGTTDVTCTAYGKVIAGGDSTAIGSPVTLSADGTATITGTTAKNYNYISLFLVAGSGAQSSKITAFSIKTANAFPYAATKITGTAGMAVTGGTIDLNASSNYAVNIGTGTTTGTVTIGGAGTQSVAIGNGAAAKTVALGSSNSTSTTTLLSGSGAVNINASNNQPTNIGTGSSTGLVTIGGGSGTAAINTSVWDIAANGVSTGLRSVTVTADADNIVLDPATDLHAVDVVVNAASKFSVDTTGNVVAAGVFSGGLQLVNVITNTDESETLTAAQSGSIVTFDGAGTATIPDASAATVGVVYYLIQTADADLIVTSTTANNNSFVCDNVATSDAVTIGTASHKIGSGMIVIGISATKWFVGSLNPESLLTPEAAD